MSNGKGNPTAVKPVVIRVRKYTFFFLILLAYSRVTYKGRIIGVYRDRLHSDTDHEYIIHLFQLAFPIVKRLFQPVFLLFHG